MTKERVIAILDIGKTNKKALLFNEDYKLVYEESATLKEIVDEDGDVCEDIAALIHWASSAITSMLNQPEYEILAVNFSAYGASWVFIDHDEQVIPPLYNYLKPLPKNIAGILWNDEAGATDLSANTRSPFLGNLNAGLQLLRLKLKDPEKWASIAHALSLPQFFSWYFTKVPASEITSIGCHTMMWNYHHHQYADWTIKENIIPKLPPIIGAEKMVGHYNGMAVGTGIHDSSAALIPYLVSFDNPFLLLSTGTWNICLNPFAKNQLTPEELAQDCLFYMSAKGKPVFASRLFAGYYHDENVRHIAKAFNVEVYFYKEIEFDHTWKPAINCIQVLENSPAEMLQNLDAGKCNSLTDAYHTLVYLLVQAQKRSLLLASQGGEIERIFVDGGFSKNLIFMKMLAREFPLVNVYGATLPQASALGAALVIHNCWNTKQIPRGLVELRPCHSTI